MPVFPLTLGMFDLILKNLSRHITLTPEEAERFTSYLQRRTLRKKQYLLQGGDISRYECFVNKGCLRTYLVDDKGQEHIVQFAIEEWWTGDMYSFINGRPSLYHIDALEDSEVFLIDRPSWEKMFVEIPKLERFYRLLLQNAFISMQRRIAENMSLSAEERYANFQQRYPHFEQRLPLKQIASYLGITPESLSRIRKKMVKG
jgi:CRP-like cAMP-binding protein